MPLWKLSAVEQAAGIRAGEFTAVELLDSVLERVDALNPSLNAIVDDLRDEAYSAAKRADRDTAAGRSQGDLHGVPVTIKVNVDLEGRPNNNGMAALNGEAARANSPVVQNLLDAGAIVIGRTNTPELSMRLTTDNPLYGLTRNPWNPEASPGGSSGGASSACAAGFGAIHHGNDIAGSLRLPASACGLATVKPGQGRLPAYNPSAPVERTLLAQLMSVQGVICREVRDVRLATRIMMRPDSRDPWQVPMPFSGSAEAAPIRVGVTCESYGYDLHPGIAANITKAADILAEAGYAVEHIDTPSIQEAAQAWFNVALREIKLALGPIAEQYGSSTIREIFGFYYRLSDMVDGDGYLMALAERTRMMREWNLLMDRYPLVLSPYLMRPSYSTDYDESFEGSKDIWESAVWSNGINYVGFPAGNIPMDLVEGLPSGVQLIGRRWREDLILDAMEVIENSNGVRAFDLWEREG